ncbi:glutaredoxin family protein [Arcobacter porcinus]|uniref:Glutaredoxin n=1 Tax=Arcobacter porcinus TaxID=1935204 RepID=A0ABX2YGB0_9BACT|nr:glutaredoxin domain-containing protein [Arcobacter porcinus]OCL82912.1 Glutaredoxin [Arcobacter porcinus]OCL84459.1 Glutaredoxin [Arcobacter porcinus]OCL89000.1 Glutaredoxin [Arcobacter porcinus]OCL93558.1 Glutaredoxin [Arcobacter porcinus]
MKPVALFTLPNCKWCNEAINYLKSKKIKYNQIDLTKDKNALKDCQKRCKGAPVILIGNSWICGFDKKRINKELGIK